MRKLALLAAVVGGTLALAPTAYADPVQDPLPIGPNQFFQGQVKGLHSGATIYVVCPGPATPGQVGHPVSGQPVQVVQGIATTSGGYTGSLGRSVVADFSPPISSTTPERLTFSSYYAPQNLPTTFLLPCSGTVKIPFVPLPTSPTAVTDYVAVTYVNIAV